MQIHVKEMKFKNRVEFIGFRQFESIQEAAEFFGADYLLSFINKGLIEYDRKKIRYLREKGLEEEIKIYKKTQNFSKFV